MNFNYIIKSNELKYEKGKSNEFYVSSKVSIDINNENFVKHYENYLKNENKSFIYSCHQWFEASNYNHLEKILCNYGTNDVVEQFNVKLACAQGFKNELVENYKMSKEDEYMENILKKERHTTYHNIKQNCIVKMEKEFNIKTGQEYDNFERHEIKKQDFQKKRKIENILLDIINVAIKLKKIEDNYGDHFLYEKLFTLEKNLFTKKIKNIDEHVQTNIHLNQTNNRIIEYTKKIKNNNIYYKNEDNNELSKFISTSTILKDQKIDNFFFLNLKNVSYLDKNNNNIEKRAFISLIEYLSANSNVLNIKKRFPNSDFLNKLSNNLWDRYFNYKEKILDQISYPDFNHVNEQMVINVKNTDKTFQYSPSDYSEGKINGLGVLKFLILNIFRKKFKKNSINFGSRLKIPIKIVITGKIKKEVKVLAKYLKNKYSLKVYDFDKIQKEAEYICQKNNVNKNESDLNEETNEGGYQNVKYKISKKLEKIINKLKQKEICDYTKDVLYVDLLYYRIKYDNDIFLNTNKKCKKYNGYIIINFFYSLRQYILYELKFKNRFFLNNFVHNNLGLVQKARSLLELETTYLKKNENNENVHPSKHINREEETNKDTTKNNKRKKNRLRKKLNSIPIEENEIGNQSKDIDINYIEKKNILFFSNFICKIFDIDKMKNKDKFESIDMHFHININKRKMNKYLFSYFNKHNLYYSISCHKCEDVCENENKFEFTHEEENENQVEDPNLHLRIYLKRLIKIGIESKQLESQYVSNIQTIKKYIMIKCNIVLLCKHLKKQKNIKKKNKGKCSFLKLEKYSEEKNKVAKYSYPYLIKKNFQYDKSYVEINKFLKSYTNSPRVYVLKKYIFKYSSKIIKKAIISSKKISNDCGERQDLKTSVDHIVDKDKIYKYVKRINIDKNLMNYFRERYLNIIRSYIIQLFNLFAWEEKFEQNINKNIKHIKKNVYSFIDFIDMHKINDAIKLQNNMKKIGIQNDKSKILMLNMLINIQKKIWINILKAKNKNYKKKYIYIQTWFYRQLIFLTFLKFNQINIEHKLYTDLQFFVHEFIYSLLHYDNIMLCKNEDRNKFYVFNYFPKNIKELFIYENGNYHFPFYNLMKKDSIKFFVDIPEDNHNKKSNKPNNSENKNNNTNQYLKHEQSYIFLAKEYKAISNFIFYYKLHEIINNSIISLRNKIYIFQDVNNKINAFVTLHYACVYNRLNYVCDLVRKHILTFKPIPSHLFDTLNGNFYNKLDEVTQLENEISFKDGEEKSDLKKEKNINMKGKMGNENKDSEYKYKNDLYTTNQQKYSYLNVTEKKRIKYAYIFIQNILNYIFIEHYFPIISRPTLENFIICSLNFIKNKSQKKDAYSFFAYNLLKIYFKKNKIVDINIFYLPESIKNTNTLKAFPQNGKELSQYIFVLDFFFFLLFFFFNSKHNGKNSQKMILQNYLNVLEAKMDKEGIMNKCEKIKILRNRLFSYEELLKPKNVIPTDSHNIQSGEINVENKNNKSKKLCISFDEMEKSRMDFIDSDCICIEEKQQNLDGLDYFNFQEFSNLCIFNIFLNKKKEKKNYKYEIFLLNKFVFRFLFAFSQMPHFYENVNAYIKNYLFKKSSNFLSLFEKCVQEKVETISRSNSNAEKIYKAHGCEKKKINTYMSWNTKKKVISNKNIIKKPQLFWCFLF
ncbi:conserved Plasmodium protein, unknown function [Plasmodium vinckei brucechwatti]|uniref:Uncharacterized protein n=1 Tax=Plasmodium vinckei brucechwatti TaxID=119398 RepID=A0A6V7RVX3_PLAVN|nr:conserved Plasmodium protein, unknown function [Plasmodium vinckei brucechwatti]